MKRLWLVVLMFCAQGLGAQTVADRDSGVPFPVSIVPPGGTTAEQLTGTATRTRTIFRIKVYAYGLYADAAVARTALAPFAGRSATALSRDPSFYARLLDLQVPLTLRLVMTRDVSGDALAGAFDDALKPRVARAAAESKGAGGPAALTVFRSYFDLRAVAKDTEIVFSCHPDGRLHTTVNGQPRPEIQSPPLCWALFDVYLGDKSISEDGRRSLVSGFAALLGAPR